ncbi:PH domain-containing protein [Mycobacterium sp. NPDC003323]
MSEVVWQRLSPRMLVVHPIHEVLNQIPLLIGAVVLGSTTQNPLWSLLGVGLIVAFGLARWFTTTYRIDDEEVSLRSGVLQRNELSVPRNRIRSVHTEARLLHRLLGLTVLRVSTGQEAKGENEFRLDAVRSEQVAQLRATLLGESAQPDPGLALARWQPSWLRYSPLSLSGLVAVGALIGMVYQAGFADRLQAWMVVALLVVSVPLAVARSLLTYGNLVLTRHTDTVGLSHGLVRVREYTYDLRRLRGGTLIEPLLVRVVGGARLDAVMTGVSGAGESSLLLPPCPAATARDVLAQLTGRADVVTGPLVSHGPAATRRRWVRAMALPVVAAVVLPFLAVPGWVWVLWALLTGVCVVLAVDRVRALGHRVDADWLVTRAGSVERRRDCVQTAGIIGWTVRQTWFQRRANVATLVAATAAGTKRYVLIDVPADWAWSVAATASVWVADSEWYA